MNLADIFETPAARQRVECALRRGALAMISDDIEPLELLLSVVMLRRIVVRDVLDRDGGDMALVDAAVEAGEAMAETMSNEGTRLAEMMSL